MISKHHGDLNLGFPSRCYFLICYVHFGVFFGFVVIACLTSKILIEELLKFDAETLVLRSLMQTTIKCTNSDHVLVC